MWDFHPTVLREKIIYATQLYELGSVWLASSLIYKENENTYIFSYAKPCYNQILRASELTYAVEMVPPH